MFFSTVAPVSFSYNHLSLMTGMFQVVTITGKFEITVMCILIYESCLCAIVPVQFSWLPF